jgi:hypothetical protein
MFPMDIRGAEIVKPISTVAQEQRIKPPGAIRVLEGGDISAIC